MDGSIDFVAYIIQNRILFSLMLEGSCYNVLHRRMSMLYRISINWTNRDGKKLRAVCEDMKGSDFINSQLTAVLWTNISDGKPHRHWI